MIVQIIDIFKKENEMKLSANSVLTAMCLALSSGAMAAPSVDVAIKGWVKPGACDITLSNKSVLNIDLGSFFTANLNEDEQTILKEPPFENIWVRKAKSVMGRVIPLWFRGRSGRQLYPSCR